MVLSHHKLTNYGYVFLVLDFLGVLVLNFISFNTPLIIDQHNPNFNHETKHI